MTWNEAKILAIAGSNIRRSGWVDRWISYASGLWWFTPFDPITKEHGVSRVVTALDWSPPEFSATDWTLEAIPDVPDLPPGFVVPPDVPPSLEPVTLYWVVPPQSSRNNVFPSIAAASDPFFNPYDRPANCQIICGQDDDTRLSAFGPDGVPIDIPLGPFVKGGDHACQGYIVSDWPIRASVTLVLPPGGFVLLQSWDAWVGNQGGTDTIAFNPI